jgi:hypothetical protein
MMIRKVTVRVERITAVVINLWAADPVGAEVYSKNPENSHNFAVILASSASN